MAVDMDGKFICIDFRENMDGQKFIKDYKILKFYESLLVELTKIDVVVQKSHDNTQEKVLKSDLNCIKNLMQFLQFLDIHNNIFSNHSEFSEDLELKISQKFEDLNPNHVYSAIGKLIKSKLIPEKS